ncbi:MAG: hypothetical protein LBU84_18980 [Prevotella sp.]|jgi:hypothetical protein|nr:hypothetical protein [Prevotella sp.]
MNENLKDNERQVMLVADPKDANAPAVTSVDKEDSIQTITPTQENMSNLLSVNTNDYGLEAFFKNLWNRWIIPLTRVSIFGGQMLWRRYSPKDKIYLAN